MPTCGQVKTIEETHVPGHDCWDVFAREINTYTLQSEDDLQFLILAAPTGPALITLMRFYSYDRLFSSEKGYILVICRTAFLAFQQYEPYLYDK